MSGPEEEPLELPRNLVIQLHQTLGQLLMPPPPGDTRKQLPNHILRLLTRRQYLSTACEMAKACTSAKVRHPRQAAELGTWATWLHEQQCRLNNKFSGELCVCECHEERPEADR